MPLTLFIQGYGQTAVQTEEYSQWVIEDKFASDFPDLTRVGAVITKDIEPYEETKLEFLMVDIHHSLIWVLFLGIVHLTR